MAGTSYKHSKAYKIKRAAYVCVACTALIGLSGCKDKNEVIVDTSVSNDMTAAQLAKNVEYLMNIRYNGYTEADQGLIENVCAPTEAALLIDELSSVSPDGLINIDDTYEEAAPFEMEMYDDEGNPYTYRGNEGYTDDRIISKDGHYYLDVNDFWVDSDNQIGIMINGGQYYIDVPDDVLRSKMKGDGSYRFSIQDYNLYDDGTFIVSLQSDLEKAFNEQYEPKVIEETQMDSEVVRSGDIGTLTKGETLTEYEYMLLFESYVETTNFYTMQLQFKVDNNKLGGFQVEKVSGQLETEEEYRE